MIASTIPAPRKPYFREKTLLKPPIVHSSPPEPGLQANKQGVSWEKRGMAVVWEGLIHYFGNLEKVNSFSGGKSILMNFLISSSTILTTVIGKAGDCITWLFDDDYDRLNWTASWENFSTWERYVGDCVVPLNFSSPPSNRFSAPPRHNDLILFQRADLMSSKCCLRRAVISRPAAGITAGRSCRSKPFCLVTIFGEVAARVVVCT